MLKIYAWLLLAASPALAQMPAAQQNALVQTYCAVCHTDAEPLGGLSLQHFDGAHADPGVAAMMVSKLKSNALGASGKPLPDKATQDALLNALLAQSSGANQWTVSGTGASIVEEGKNKNVYRLTLTCRAGKPEAQLAWSPGVPKQGTAVSAMVDGRARLAYEVVGLEPMGMGSDLKSGPGSMILTAMPIPQQTLTVTGVFGDEGVEFPFRALNQEARDTLSKCFRP
jgi:hypothetical protein